MPLKNAPGLFLLGLDLKKR